MSRKLIKRILGKKLIRLYRSIKTAHPKKISIVKNGKRFTVNCLELDRYMEWLDYKKGNYEPKTFKIFDKFLDEDHSYIDIGAYIGPTVLYACQLAKHCFAIEPDPIACKELKNNIALNAHLKSKITVSELAISNRSGTTKFFTPAEYLGGGEVAQLFYIKDTRIFGMLKQLPYKSLSNFFLLLIVILLKLM